MGALLSGELEFKHDAATVTLKLLHGGFARSKQGCDVKVRRSTEGLLVADVGALATLRRACPEAIEGRG